MSRYLTVALEVLIIVLILFVPLAFACTQYWAWTIMEMGVAVALVLWLVLSILERRLSIVKTPLNIIMVVLLLYVFFQLIPLPPALAGLLSAKHVALVTGPDGIVPGRVPLSVSRYETLQSLFRGLAYCGFFFLLVNFANTRARVARVIAATVLAGVLVAFLGVATSSQSTPQLYRKWSTGNPNENPTCLNARADRHFSSGVGFVRPIEELATVHWFRTKTKGGPAFGCFPSQNQAAGFMLMMLPVALGTLFACLGSKRDEWGPAGGFFYSREGNLLLLSLVVVALLVVGVVMTKSRDALLVMGPVLVVTFLLVGFTASLLRGIITTVVLTVLILASILIVGWLDLGDTVREAANRHLHVNPANPDSSGGIWETSGRIASDFKLTGTGAGTYASIYPHYNTGGPQAYFAHCDMLQFRVETGIIGTALAGAAFVVYLVTAIIGLVKMRDKFMRRILIGTFVGTLAVLTHSLTDFDLYVPATAFVLVVLSAVTVVLARDRNSRRTEEDFVFGHRHKLETQKSKK